MFIVSLPTQITAVVCVSGLVAGFTDLRSRRIPNWLSSLVLLFGVSIHTHYNGLPGSATAILGALCCGAAFLPFYIVGGMGAGDVKLVAAEGCVLGLGHSLSFLFATAICGAVMAFAVAAKNRSIKATLLKTKELTAHHLESGLIRHPGLSLSNAKAAHVPYALAIGSGALMIIIFDNLGQGYQ